MLSKIPRARRRRRDKNAAGRRIWARLARACHSFDPFIALLSLTFSRAFSCFFAITCAQMGIRRKAMAALFCFLLPTRVIDSVDKGKL